MSLSFFSQEQQLHQMAGAISTEVMQIGGTAKAEGRKLSAEEEAHLTDLEANHAKIVKALASLKADRDHRGEVKAWIEEIHPTPPGQTVPVHANNGHLTKAGLVSHSRWGSADWGTDALTGVTDPHGKAIIAPGQPLPVALPAPPIVTEVSPVTVLRSLLDTANAVGGGFRYLKQNLRDNQAAVVPRGALKPTSRYSLEWKDGRVSVIAHVSEAMDRFDFSDAPALGAFLSSEMRSGTEQALEAAILTGPAGSEFVGFLNAGIDNAPAVGTPLDSIRTAMGELEIEGNTVTGVVMSSQDWTAMELAKDTTGRYLLDAGPVDRNARRIWGRPIVVCPAMEPGKALIGDFRGSAALVVADGGQVLLSYSEHTMDTFVRNQVVWRAEVRANLAVLRPSAFLAVDVSGSEPQSATRSAKK